MKRYIVLLLVLSFFSCSTARKITTSHSQITIRHDSTATNHHDSTFFSRIETIKDTEFIVKPDSASIRALIKCNDRGEAFLQQIIRLKNGRQISQSISLKNNVLYVQAKIDSAAIYFQYKETHIKEATTATIKTASRETQNTQTTDKKTTVKKVTRWPPWLYLIIIAAAGWLFYKYLLPFIKPFL